MDQLFNIVESNKRTELFNINKPESYEILIKDELYEDNKIHFSKDNLYVEKQTNPRIMVMHGGCDFESQLPEINKILGYDYVHDTRYSVSLTDRFGSCIKKDTTDILIRKPQIFTPNKKIGTAHMLVFISDEEISKNFGRGIYGLTIRRNGVIHKKLSLNQPIILERTDQHGFFKLTDNWRIISLTLRAIDL